MVNNAFLLGIGGMNCHAGWESFRERRAVRWMVGLWVLKKVVAAEG